MADYVIRGTYIETEKEYNSENKITKLTLKLSEGSLVGNKHGEGIRVPAEMVGKGYTGGAYPFEYYYYLYSCDVNNFLEDCVLTGDFPTQSVGISIDWDINQYSEGTVKNWAKGRNYPSFMMESTPKSTALSYAIGDLESSVAYGNYDKLTANGQVSISFEEASGTEKHANQATTTGWCSPEYTSIIGANASDDRVNISFPDGASEGIRAYAILQRLAIFTYAGKLYGFGYSNGLIPHYIRDYTSDAEGGIVLFPNFAGVFLEDKQGHLIALSNGYYSLCGSNGEFKNEYNSVVVYRGVVTDAHLTAFAHPSQDSLGDWYGQNPIISVVSDMGYYILPNSVAALFGGIGTDDGIDIPDENLPDPDTPSDDTNGGDPDDPGDGKDSDDGDTESFAPVPPDITGTGTGAGFCLHKVTADQLQNVIEKIFSTGDGSFVSSAKTFFGLGDNPFHYTPTELMQLILSCHCIPISNPTGGSSTKIWCGFYDTGIMDTKSINLWQNFTYGTVTVTKPTGTFIDTAGYRRIFIHVPFCGMFELDPSEVYGKTLSLSGRMNALTGQMMVTLSVSGKVLYTYTGCACIPIPLTAEDCSGAQRALLSAGVSVIAGIATGAVGGAIAGAGIAASGAASGATAASVSGATVSNQFSTASGMASTIGNGVNSMVQNSTQAPAVAHSGGLGGGASAMDLQQAYLVIENREYVTRGDTYISTLGIPSGKACKLSQLGNGSYAECSAVNLGLSGATSEEVNLAKKLLIQGVIV